VTGTVPRRACLLAWPFLAGIAGSARAAPQRIVALDWSLAETVAALGVVPAAVAEVPGYRTWIGEPGLPAEVVDLGLLTEPNLELLVQLAPDLILVGDGQEGPIGRLVERVAPTVAVSIHNGEGRPLGRARAATLDLARRLGREEAGEAFLARADRAMAEVRRHLSAAQRRHPLLVFLFQDDRHGWVADANGLVQDVMDELGLTNAWQAPPSFWGFTPVGIDALASRPEAGLAYSTLFLDDPASALASPLWQALPAVRAGRAAALPRFWYFGAVPTAMRLAGFLGSAVAAMRAG
jgi:iron complex transport system substrate-binding protein